MEKVGPGQHATSPKYVRKRRNAEKVMARADKQAERRARKAAPKAPPEVLVPPEEAYGKVRRILNAALTRTIAGWTARGIERSPAQIKAYGRALTRLYRRSLAEKRWGSKGPGVPKAVKRRRRQIAARSRARNR